MDNPIRQELEELADRIAHSTEALDRMVEQAEQAQRAWEYAQAAQTAYHDLTTRSRHLVAEWRSTADSHMVSPGQAAALRQAALDLEALLPKEKE